MKQRENRISHTCDFTCSCQTIRQPKISNLVSNNYVRYVRLKNSDLTREWTMWGLEMGTSCSLGGSVPQPSSSRHCCQGDARRRGQSTEPQTSCSDGTGSSCPSLVGTWIRSPKIRVFNIGLQYAVLIKLRATSSYMKSETPQGQKTAPLQSGQLFSNSCHFLADSQNNRCMHNWVTYLWYEPYKDESKCISACSMLLNKIW